METQITPAEAFDLHTTYVEWRKKHPKDDRLIHDGYWRASTQQSAVVSRTALEQSMKESLAFHNAMRLIDDVSLTHADTVFLSDDLRELVKTAEVTMPDEVLFRTDVYTPCALVVMETPLELTVRSWCIADDVDSLIARAKTLNTTVSGERKHEQADNGRYVGTEVWDIVAFSWADEASIDSLIKSEADKRFAKDSYEREIIREAWCNDGETGLEIRVYGVIRYTEIDGVRISIDKSTQAPLRLVDRYRFIYGEDGVKKESLMREPNEELLDEGNANEVALANEAIERWNTNRRFIIAMLRLMEEYVDIDRESAPRAHSRRAGRSGRLGNIKDVVVMSLRRAEYDSEGVATGRTVTLAHLVRGHWRNQWYPSMKAHRAKWIQAHRRGGNKGDEVTAKPRLIRVDR
jgi:hypothetical protein